MSRLRILFVKHYTISANFLYNDVNILQKKYDVNIYTSNIKKNYSIIFSLLKQFFYLLFSIHKYKLIYVWFADYHSFLPTFLGKIFNKKIIIVVGGYDATNIPEIDCGAFNEENLRKKIRSFAVKYSLKNCDCILVVDDSLIENENTYVYSDNPDKRPLKDGILNFLPQLKNKIKVVYTGFDENYFRRDEKISKENFILSVGYSPNENEFRRKGFDLLLEAAKNMRSADFVLIGLNSKQIENLSKLNLPNLKLIGIVSMNELKSYYNKAKVFAQLSLFEGQPNSLCEAMMYECVPVGSNVNGIPSVINSTGFIVYKKDIDEICYKLKMALESPSILGKSAKERIIKNFSLEARRKKILEIISDFINS